MKITELQAQLEAIKLEHGDLECLVSAKNFNKDRYCDFKVESVVYDDSAISPDVISVCTRAAAIYVSGIKI